MTNEPKSWQRKTVKIPLEREVEDTSRFLPKYVCPSNHLVDNSGNRSLRFYHVEDTDPNNHLPKAVRGIYCKQCDQIYALQELGREETSASVQ